MSKLPQFLIINFVHVLYFFQVLSTVQPARVSWALSMKKAAT